MKNKRFGALSSSINPQELSLTVLSSFRVIAGALVAFGIFTVVEKEAIETSLEQIMLQVAVIVPAAYSLWNTANVVFGLFQKVLVRIGEWLASRSN